MNEVYTQVSGQSQTHSTVVESVSELVQGLITYGKALLSSFPDNYHYLGKDQLLHKIEELEVGLHGQNTEKELAGAEECIELLEKAEIAFEEWKLEQEEHIEEGTTEGYLDLVMTNPDKIPIQTPGRLSIFGITLGTTEAASGNGFFYRLHFITSNGALLCLALCCFWGGVTILGTVDGVYAWYLLFIIGVIGICLFLISNVLRIFGGSPATHQTHGMVSS